MSSTGPRTPIDPVTGHSIFSLMPASRLRMLWQDEPSVDLADSDALEGAFAETPGPAADAAPWAPADAEDGAGPGAVCPVCELVREPPPPTPAQGALEQGFPSVTALLMRVWGRRGAGRAFRTLLLDGGGLVRRWPAAVWDELVLLGAVHRLAHGDIAGGDAHGVDPAQFSVMEVRYRHALEPICDCWGDRDRFAVVYQMLVFDHRCERAGWPPEAWEELVLLQQVHDRVHGRPAVLHDSAAGPAARS